MTFHSAKDAETFILAGNAIVTLESLQSGQHYTYRIRKFDDTERWGVSLLTGPNNTSDFSYLGVIDGPEDARTFRLTQKSRMKPESVPVKAFQYAWERVYYGKIPAKLVIRHEGRCGRCARTLTVPESIDRGIGPECAKHAH